ncbi:hypothetical protein [Zavarzinia aquatilis]|uniref:Uncharacterized protein n=1 Tax=Zavarzinia aquatilis TaxID=2211142 RepID=A0A317DXP4_9PROT|nr:hypothetical protein [Zavarzinia aquatilis]PWR19498.1 hypothetical protein DKG74_17055 [Zavarzinia aquatilis]
MCGLCAALGGSRYWTDAAGSDAFTRNGGKVTLRAERERRVAFLNRVLDHYGLTVHDWGGNSYVLSDRRGRRENVYNLEGIWSLVDRMAATDCDPLDPALLSRLGGAS